jgi:Putative beta barrel porin-7 (BBP7)
MAINRTRAWLLVWTLQLTLVGMAYADQPGTPQPGGIAEAPFVDDVQIFSPGDFSTYGSGPPRNQGWFGGWEALRWGTSVAKRTTIGNENFSNVVIATSGNQFDTPTFIQQPNTLDTGFLGTAYSAGYRWEGGYANGEVGWLFSAFRLYDNNQRFLFNHVGVNFDPGSSVGGPYGPMSVLRGFADNNHDGFDDDINLNGHFGRDGFDFFTGATGLPPPDGIPETTGFPADVGDIVTLPVFFTQLSVVQHTEIWGTEANRMWRVGPAILGANWDILGGVRYFKFDETFRVNTTGSILNHSYWNTRGNNNLVGPQIGLRGFWSTGRLTMSMEGRFLAAANIQQLTQRGEIGTQTDPSVVGNSLTLLPTEFFHASRQVEFSPLGEIRANASWNVFRSVALTVGWTGIVVNDIARPSKMINYVLPDMGIRTHSNRQVVFIEGLTLGVQINR